MPQVEDNRRQCWQCRHLGISHDARFPYLCRALGIKSRVLPSLEVLRVDGRACEGFSQKPVGTAMLRGRTAAPGEGPLT